MGFCGSGKGVCKRGRGGRGAGEESRTPEWPWQH